MSQTIAGALVGGALGAFGEKVQTRDLPQLDFSKIQGDAINANIANFAQAEKLTSMANMANQTELNKLIEMQLPGGSQIIKDNIMAGIQGKLSPGTLVQLKRLAAEKGVGGQGVGSNFNLAGEISDFTTKTEDLITQRMDSASRWIAQTLAPRMGVQSMFIDPLTRINLDVSERDKKFMADTRNDQIRAAPDPNMVQLAEGFDNFFKTWSSIGTMAAGNAMGGGGAPKSSGSNSMFTDEFSQGMF